MQPLPPHLHPHNIISLPQTNPSPMQSPPPFFPCYDDKLFPINPMNNNNNSNYSWNPKPSYSPYPSNLINVSQFTHMNMNMNRNMDRNLKRKRRNINMEYSSSCATTLGQVPKMSKRGAVVMDRPSESCTRGDQLANSLLASKAINIPDNLIVYEILVRLPVKSILRFRCVCKHWNSLTQEKHFEDVHLEHSKIRCNSDYTGSSNIIFRSINLGGHSLHYFGEDYHKTFDFSNFPTVGHCKPKLSNSCRGLICIYSMMSIQLVNPSTDECTELPPCSSYTYEVALAYDVSIHKYKVARLFWRHHSFRVGCEILTLGSFQSSWRDIGDLPMDYILEVDYHSLVVDEGGRIYWGTTRPGIAISLDIQSETFDAIMPPKDYCCMVFPDFAELGGCFCLYNHQFDQVDLHIYLHLWMLKDCLWVNYRIKLDLREHRCYSRMLHLHPLSIRYGKILLSDGNFYCWCDLKSGTLFDEPIILDHHAFSGSYFETLVSPIAIQWDK